MPDVLPLSRFLLPVDDSEPSRRGVSCAGCLAAALGARVEEICLLHVVQGHYLSQHMENVDFRVEEVLQSEAMRQVREHRLAEAVAPVLAQAEQELRRLGVQGMVHRRVEAGAPPDQIARVALDGGYSTIVMGRSWGSLAWETLLGDFTLSLLHRPHAATLYMAGQEVLENERCLLPRVLVPLDGSPHSEAALREAAALASASPRRVEEIVLLRVIDPARFEKQPAGKAEEEAREIVARGCRLLAAAAIPEAKVATAVRSGAPAEIILETAAQERSTLILMGRRGRSAWRDLVMGGVSTEVLQRCQEPTIAIVSAALPS